MPLFSILPTSLQTSNEQSVHLSPFHIKKVPARHCSGTSGQISLRDGHPVSAM